MLHWQILDDSNLNFEYLYIKKKPPKSLVFFLLNIAYSFRIITITIFYILRFVLGIIIP